MRNILICFLIATTCVAQGVVKFSGKITNPNSDKITLKGEGFQQEIKVWKDGTFSSEFNAPEAIYQFYDGAEYTKVYLKNGYDLYMTLDTAQFDESIVFKGTGAAENNVLVQDALQQEKLEPKILAAKDDVMAFSKLFREFREARDKRMNAPGIDPGLKKRSMQM
jgi:hypothetical protein